MPTHPKQDNIFTKETLLLLLDALEKMLESMENDPINNSDTKSYIQHIRTKAETLSQEGLEEAINTLRDTLEDLQEELPSYEQENDILEKEKAKQQEMINRFRNQQRGRAA